MRRMLSAVAIAAVGAGIVACGSSASSSSSSGGSSGSTTASCSNSAIQKELYQKGQLTVATDKPVYPPWFENNKPSNGKGYESAVAYAIAKQLGFKNSQVVWAYEPFNASYAPGPKKFDFDINEISVHPAAGHGRDVLQQLLRRAAGARGAEEHADRDQALARPT